MTDPDNFGQTALHPESSFYMKHLSALAIVFIMQTHRKEIVLYFSPLFNIGDILLMRFGTDILMKFCRHRRHESIHWLIFQIEVRLAQSD